MTSLMVLKLDDVNKNLTSGFSSMTSLMVLKLFIYYI